MKINYAVWAILLGLWFLFSPTSLIFSLLASLILITIYVKCRPEEKKFVLFLFISGFLLRILFLSFYHWGYLVLLKKPDIIGPDGEAYIKNGWFISRILFNKNITLPPSGWPNPAKYSYLVNITSYARDYILPEVGGYQIGPYTYFIAYLFFIFGYVPLMVKFINVFFSVLMGVVVYFMAKDLFERKIAKISSILVSFFPSTFLFSITALKDTIANFFLVFMVWLLIRYNQRGRIAHLALTIPSLLFLYFLRDRFVLFYLCAALLSLFVTRVRFSRKLAILILCVALINFTPFKNRLIKQFNLYQIFRVHYGYVGTPGRNYKLYPEYFYAKSDSQIEFRDTVVAFFKGSVHALLEPFLWKASTTEDLLFYPQMLFWYFLLPFSALGLIIGLRYNYSNTMCVFIFLLVMHFVLSLFEGNVGTVFRHREMVVPFILILAVAGLNYSFVKKTSSP